MGSSNSKIEFNTLHYLDGETYEGEIINNKRTGYGINYYPNGNKYEGWWENDLKNGTGTFYFNDGSLYVGQWINNKKNGIGTIYYKSGDRYYGNFENGEKNGKGLFISRDNNRYIGNYKNNQKHGKGIMYYNKNKKLSKEIWNKGILISSKIIYLNINNQKTKDTMKIISNKNYLGLGFFLENLTNNTINNDESELNKNLTLNIAKYFKARIPNNYFDAMNFIILTSDLLYNNSKIYEWNEKNIITWMNRIGIEKNKYKNIIIENNINGGKFLQFSAKELKEYNINNIKDGKLILKSIDFLRIFLRLYTDYSEKYEFYINMNNFSTLRDTSTKNLTHVKFIRQKKHHSSLLIDNKKLEANKNKNVEHKIRRTLSFKNSNYENSIKNENYNLSTIYTSYNNGNGNNNISNYTINSNYQNYNKIIENVDSTLTKISLTKVLLHSLNLCGFNFYIPFKELKFLKKIGEGGFGEVYLGLWNEKKVAIKKISFINKKEKDPFHLKKNSKDYQNKINNNFNLKSILLKFIKEIDIISNLRHPNIVLFMGASISNNNCYLITEYIENGNLFDLLHKKKLPIEINFNKFDIKFTTNLAYEIALSIKYLHSRNITHCDLKSSNILLDKDFHVKLTDFGLSKIVNIMYDNENDKKGKFGTTHWMPPEIMKSLKYEEKSDVFSYGMILYEIISGKIPYYGMLPNQIIALVSGCRKIIQVPENSQNIFLDKLVKKCLKYNIQERPNFKDIINYLEIVKKNIDNKDFIQEDLEKFIN